MPVIWNPWSGKNKPGLDEAELIARIGQTRLRNSLQQGVEGFQTPWSGDSKKSSQAKSRSGKQEFGWAKSQSKTRRRGGAGSSPQPGPGAGHPTGPGTQAAGAGGDIDALLSLIGGGGGGPDTGALAGSFDKQIAALRGAGDRMAGLTDQLIGGYRDSSARVQGDIGGFFGYAADQARAGIPVTQETHATASRNVDGIYDDLASNLAQLPQTQADHAKAAGGSGMGGHVADRVAAAAAPFAAAGETSRASAKANLAEHSSAGQNYLNQLASAAPQEAAMAQSGVADATNKAVTQAQMALAEQQGQIEMQAAQIEGSKQRALLEYSADTAGDTFDRLMKVAQLDSAMKSPSLRSAVGLPNQAESASPMDVLKLQHQGLQNQALIQQLSGDNAPSPYELGGMQGFEAALGESDKKTQKAAQQILSQIEANPEFDQAKAYQLAGAIRPKEKKTTERRTNWSGILPGGKPFREDHQGSSSTAKTLDELAKQIVSGDTESPSLHMPGVDKDTIRQALRAYFAGA